VATRFRSSEFSRPRLCQQQQFSRYSCCQRWDADNSKQRRNKYQPRGCPANKVGFHFHDNSESRRLSYWRSYHLPVFQFDRDIGLKSLPLSSLCYDQSNDLNRDSNTAVEVTQGLICDVTIDSPPWSWLMTPAPTATNGDFPRTANAYATVNNLDTGI
jgi:hypothetical protein